jgi:hypothetical protein
MGVVVHAMGLDSERERERERERSIDGVAVGKGGMETLARTHAGARTHTHIDCGTTARPTLRNNRFIELPV